MKYHTRSVIGAMFSMAMFTVTANATTVLMDFSANNIGSNFGVINGANYQPLPGVVVTYINAGVYNGGPDHTPGDSAGADFNLFQNDGSAYAEPSTVTLSITFSVPVTIDSLWTSTFQGGSGTINISAFSDEAGTSQLGSTQQMAPLGGVNPIQWQEFTGFSAAPYAGQVRRISFLSSVAGGQAASSFQSNIQVDDILVTIPEPSSTLLTSFAAAGLLLRRRKRG